MTIRLLHNGAWRISNIIRGYLVTKTYYGYTKWEAIRLFKAATNQETHS